jgi:WD40 repeat protein
MIGLSCITLLVMPLLLSSGSSGEEPSPAEIRAEAALNRLAGRLAGSSSEQSKVRKELLVLRLTVPGTPSGIKASSLLAQLPSPLDRLDPKSIAKIERFDWQPKELVALLGEHRGRHGAQVSCVAYSLNGALIASGGAHLVRLWRPSDMRLLGVIGHSYGVSSVAFSRDSKSLVGGGGSGAVAVWDVSEVAKGKLPQQRFAIAAGTSPVYGVAFHPNNNVVAVACYDNTFRLYDVSGKAAKDVGTVTQHKKAVTAIGFSPDGKTLATASSDESVRLWTITGTEVVERSRLEHGRGVTTLAFSPSGRTLATGCGDGTIMLWPMPAGERPKPRITHKGPGGPVTSLCFNRAGDVLAATQGDKSVRFWSVRAAALVSRGKLDGHGGVVTAAAYSPDMRLMVSGANDWTVRTWDLRGKPVERFVPWSHLSAVYSIAFAPDSLTIVSGSEDRVVRFWDLNRPNPRTRSYLKGDSVPVYAVAYSPDGTLFAAGGQSTKVRQWDALGGTPKPSCMGHPGYVYSLTYSPDGKRLLTSSGKELFLWEAARGRELRRFGPHETLLTCMDYSADGRQVLSGSGYYLYKDGKLVLRDGKYVYTDCVLRLWDADGGSEVATIKDADTPWYSAGFSPDDRYLFAGNYEARLRCWLLDGKKIKEVKPWKAGYGYVNAMLFTPDGRAMVTRGLDGKIIVWDLATGKRLHEWVFHEHVGGLAVAADSRHLGVALTTGVVYILRLRGPDVGKPGALKDRAIQK